MAMLRIDVPADLKEYVGRRDREDGFKDVSEFICNLISTDQREAARSVLEAELLRGLDSGPPQEMTPSESRSPELGIVGEFRSSRLTGIRRWRIDGFEDYLVFYRVHLSELQVIRVIHRARDIETLFGK